MRFLLIPLDILKFWYLEAPVALLSYFMSLDSAILNYLSLPLMVRTFFRPWKNEYRQEFVRFSIVMGMVFKTLLIIVDLFMFLVLLVFEFAAFMAFLSWPLATVCFLFVKF